MKVVLTRPPIDALSGVSAYFRAVEHHLNALGHEIVPVEVGSLAARRGRHINDQRAFRRAVDETRPGLVHVNPSLNPRSFFRDGFLVRHAVRRRVPVLVEFHGWSREFAGTVGRFPLSTVFGATYARAGDFIVLAEEFRDALSEWVAAGRIHVDTTAVDDRLLAGFDIAAKLESPPAGNRFTALFMARVERTKGIYETIEACSRLLAGGADVRLVVGGDGSELEGARRAAAESLGERAEFLGFVSDDSKVAALTRADVFLLPTTHAEGMPTSVLEAMAFGVPVVARPVGGVRDFFVNGEHGFLTESTDPAEFASLVRDAVSDAERWRHMSAVSHDYAMERFLGSAVATRIAGIYRTITEQG